MEFLDFLLDRQEEEHGDSPHSDSADAPPHSDSDEHHDNGGEHNSSSHNSAGGHDDPEDFKLCPSAETSCILQDLADCGTGHDDVCANKFTFLIFPLLSLFIGTLAQPLSRVIKVSYTLVLLIVGILLGILGCWVDMGLLTLSLQQWVHIHPPTAFFYVFLAPLIFEAAFNTRWHVFKRLLIPILTAAFIIVTLQVGLIAGFQKLVIRTPGWSWWAALMYGSMLSATDPISVTATLKSLGASEFLNTLIEGESLLNDGSAFVLWEAFYHNNIHPPEDQLSVGAVVGSVFRLSLGGAAMGIAFGIVALLILGLVYDEFEVETSITVIVAFLGFWTAQAPSKLSGVICNVASGLVISAFGRHLITPAVRAPLAEFWELLSWIANTIVFVHAGVLLTGFIWSCAGEPNEWYDYLYIIVYYLYLQFIRMGLILIFLPVMRIRNKWFQWKEAFVVGFSGLRGAVSLVLALEVGGSQRIPNQVRTHVVIWSTGIVGLSLLVNGFLIKPLISALKLDKAKKSREDFLDRARALMVQKTLSILDSLAIENSFKCARWSYVRKMVLPEEWLNDSSHGAGYRDFVEQVLDNTNAARRKSLEVVRQDAQDKIIHSQITHRMSVEFGTRSTNATPHMSPRPTRYDYAADIARYSRSPGGMRAGAPRISAGGGTLGPAAINDVERHTSPFAVPLATPISTRRVPSRFQEIPNLGEETLGPAAVGPDSAAVDTRTVPVTPKMSGLQPLALGPPSGIRTSTDIHRNRSIDADVERYGNFNRDKMPAQSHADIQRELAELHRSVASGEHDDLTEKDREVRRRLLTAILSHVRAISNTSLVEFSVLHNLEQDCQKALDANEEGHEYDLFSFLDDRGRPTRGPTAPVFNFAISLLEGKKLRGESAIITAFIVSGIMTEILKEDTLHESAIVQFQAEKLYQGASALLNRLETINPDAFEFVESQFAVYMCEDKQDGVLADLHESGIVDDSEHKTLHHELIEVRRKYVHRRHSMFHRTRKLPARPSPRQLLTKHPLFVGMSKEQMRIVDRYGELVHLKAGQALQSERGSLVLVLQGSIRPLGESVLPPTVASHLRKSNMQVSMADEGRSPVMRKNVDYPDENAWNEAYKGDDPSGYGNGDNDNSSGNDGTATGTGTGTGNGHDDDMRKIIASQDRTAVVTPLGAGGEMYWSFPPHNAFCGPMVTLLSHVDSDGDPIKIAKERTMDTHFGCCEIAGKATVFTLPVNQVERLAKSSETFRMEITRSLARQIVLESVSDHRPYSLSQFADSVAGVLDVHTVAGRAIRVLERLPYMKVVPLRAGESAVHLQGPGVLLNGMVRVSIVDTSGLVGAINLLHEQLVGPALLPAGGLLIEEVHTAEDPTVIRPDISQEGLGTAEDQARPATAAASAAGGAAAAYDAIEKDAGRGAQRQTGLGQILAHVLIEEMVTTSAGVDKTAVLRLQRWTAEDELVDMNGRFGMNRHVELAPLSQVRIGK